MRLLHEHPNVKQFFARPYIQTESRPFPQLRANWLRQLRFQGGRTMAASAKLTDQKGMHHASRCEA